MKRFMLFGYDCYYPGGGPNDVLGNFDTLDEVLKFLNIKDNKYDYYDMLDLDERKWIEVTKHDNKVIAIGN